MNRKNKQVLIKNKKERQVLIKNKRAQELSASWGLEWFIQNIAIWVLLMIILGFGLFFLLRWLTG